MSNRFIPDVLLDKLVVHSGSQPFLKIAFPVEDPSHPGFFIIPGFSRYRINRNGTIINVALNRYMSWYRDKAGYAMFGLTSDNGVRAIHPAHRLLAIAFIPTEKDYRQLDVNHKDGDKTNNSLGNLEWASRQANCLHAYSTGLRSDNIRVLVRDLRYGKDTEYFSLEECGRVLGCDGETVRLRIKSDGQRVFMPGILIKRADSQTPWLPVSDLSKELRRNGLRRTIKVQWSNGDVIEYPSMGKAAKALGINLATLSWRIANKAKLETDVFKVLL